MRILFITSTRIGDAVFSTGLLDHLLQAYPEARFTVACGAVAEGVFARMPRREATIIIVKRRYDLHWLGLWARTVGHLWDLAIDLRGSALTFMIPARRRAVLRGGRRPGCHILRHLAGVLGVQRALLPVAWMAPEDHARAATLLPPGPPVIGLGPTANSDYKMWPADRFAALCGALAAGPLPGARAAVFAGPGAAERARAAPVLAALPDAIDLTGRVSLPEAAACIARCGLFIGNDSGLTHLAASTGAPTLALFGQTGARDFGPLSPRAAVAGAGGPEADAPIAALSVEVRLCRGDRTPRPHPRRGDGVRVAQIMAGATAGGAELFFERLCIALARAGETVLPVIRRDAGRAARLAAGELPPVELGFGGALDFATGPRLRRTLRRFAPTVAVAWMNRAARFAPVGGWVLAGRLGGYYDLRHYRSCQHLIGNTRGLVAWMRQQGIAESRTHYLPNFAPNLVGAAPATVEVGPGPRLLSLGRLHRNKAFDVLIRALPRLPGVQAVIAGDGPERGALEALARRESVADRVHSPAGGTIPARCSPGPTCWFAPPGSNLSGMW